MTSRSIEPSLKILLGNYKAQVSTMREAWVFDREGLILGGSREKAGKQELGDTLGALARIVEPVLKRIHTYQIGTFGTGIFEAEEYRLVFVEAGPQAILLTVLNFDATVDDVLPYTYLVAERIASIIESGPGEHFLEVPKFHTEMQGALFSPVKKDGELVISTLKACEAIFKLIVLGDEKVGKTTLINSFVTKKFKEDYRPTLGISITEQIFNVQGFEQIQQKFLIYDIAGQKFFKRIRKHYYQGAHAGFLMYDITSRKTFEHLLEWYDDARQNLPDLPLVLIGNKIDLADQRQVSFQEGEQWAKDHQCSFIETSAKTGQNIKDVFHLVGIKLFFTSTNH